jgi:spermidine synthase
MDWFTEYYNGCGLTIEVVQRIAEYRGLQKIEVYQTTSFGKMLVIDGKIQLTEFDEKFYHEMLVHVPMFVHPNPKKVLIVGGGDGGAAREALKHNPELVVVCEVDRKVIELCRRYIGIDSGAFDDERVMVEIEDGKKYLEGCEKFDVIIVDSTDPTAVSKPLFDREFFDLASQKGNLTCCQSQSPLIQRNYFRTLLENSSVFKERRVYISYVPTYPLGLWSFLLGGKNLYVEPKLLKKRFSERFVKNGIQTEYYNPSIHLASFKLPEWLRREVEMEIQK